MGTTPTDEMWADEMWADEIERSFGDGPTPPPPATYVVAGRTAVRRRRLAASAVSLAAVLVVGGIGWATLPGDARAGAEQVATDPSPTATATASPTPTTAAAPELAPLADSPDDVRVARPEEREQLVGGPSVNALADGALVHRAGWVVERLEVTREVRRADGHREREWGIAARPEVGGQAEWILLTWSNRGTSGATWDAPGKRFSDFDSWLDATVAAQRGLQEPEVASSVGGELRAPAGVTVLESVPAPEEAAAYGPVDEMFAARLRLADDTVVFALVGPDQTTTVDPAVLEAPTMAAFLRHLAAQGDNGEGLR